jgi:hypothetical protein
MADIYQNFRGPFCFHHQGDDEGIKMEARTSDVMVNFYQTTQCYNPEESHIHNSC